MPSPDKLFTLDPLETKITAPTSSFQAQTGYKGDSGLSTGLSALGAAIQNLAEFKKQEQIREDTRIAEEAAAREEVMPGGLLPIAQRAYKNVVDVNTSHSILLEAQNYVEGDEFTTVVKDLTASSRTKTDVLKNNFALFKQNAFSSIQNPEVLQKFNLSMNEIQSKQEKLIYEVEKDGETLQTIEGIKNTVKDAQGFAERTGVELDETFTSNWISNMAKDITTALPWMPVDEAKLLTFQVLAQDEEMLSNPQIIGALMNGEFSKGFTYESLYLGKGDDAEAFKKIYDQYQKDSNEYLKAIAKAEKDADKERTDQIKDLGMDVFIEKGSAEAGAFLEEHGIPFPAIETQLTAYKAYEENVYKNGEGSEAYLKLYKAILNGDITTKPHFNSVFLSSYIRSDLKTTLKDLMTEEGSQRVQNIKTYTDSVATINKSLLTWIKMSLKDKGDIFELAQNMSKDSEQDMAIMAAALDSTGIDPDEFMTIIKDLQTLRSNMESTAILHGNKNAKEDTDPDVPAFRNYFEGEVDRLKDRISNVTKTVALKNETERQKGLPSITSPSPSGEITSTFIDQGSSIFSVEGLGVPTKSKEEVIAEQQALNKAAKGDFTPLVPTINKIKKMDVHKAQEERIIQAMPRSKEEQAIYDMVTKPKAEIVTSLLTPVWQKKLSPKKIAENPEALRILSPAKERKSSILKKFTSMLDMIWGKDIEPREPISQRTKESSKEEPLILGKPTGRVTTEGRIEYENNKGGTSTEYTVGVKNPKINNGELTHIPSIYNGKRVDQKEAERIIIANDGKDPETGRFITAGGNPEERSKSISFDKEIKPVGEEPISNLPSDIRSDIKRQQEGKLPSAAPEFIESRHRGILLKTKKSLKRLIGDSTEHNSLEYEETSGERYNTMYPEHAGTKNIPTIGIGFNLIEAGAKKRIENLGYNYNKVVSGKQRISNIHIDTLFLEDVKTSVKEAKSVFSNFDSLPDNAASVVTKMIFQLGLPRFKGFKEFIKAVKKQDWDKAAKEILTSTKKDGTIVKSSFHKQVPARANRLAKQITGK
jgi:hypothetical protein